MPEQKQETWEEELEKESCVMTWLDAEDLYINEQDSEPFIYLDDAKDFIRTARRQAYEEGRHDGLSGNIKNLKAILIDEEIKIPQKLMAHIKQQAIQEFVERCKEKWPEGSPLGVANTYYNDCWLIVDKESKKFI